MIVFDVTYMSLDISLQVLKIMGNKVCCFEYISFEKLKLDVCSSIIFTNHFYSYNYTHRSKMNEKTVSVTTYRILCLYKQYLSSICRAGIDKHYLGSNPTWKNRCHIFLVVFHEFIRDMLFYIMHICTIELYCYLIFWKLQ